MAQAFELVQSVLSAAGDRISNTLHLLNTGTDLAAVDLVELWLSDLKTPYLAMLPGTYVLDRVEGHQIVDYGSTGPATYLVSDGSAGTRPDAGAPLPDEIMCRATLYTDTAGRRYRGSMQAFGACISDIQVSNPDLWVLGSGKLKATLADYLDAVLALWGAGGDVHWSVFSRFIWKAEGLTGTPTAWCKPIAAYHVQPDVRTRRGRGRASR